MGRVLAVACLVATRGVAYPSPGSSGLYDEYEWKG